MTEEKLARKEKELTAVMELKKCKSPVDEELKGLKND